MAAAATTDAAAYKAVQHEMISNLKGTSIQEVAFILSILPISLWCYNEVMMFLHVLGVISPSSPINPIALFVIEFGVLICPLIVSFTWTEYTLTIATSLLGVAFVLYLINWHQAMPALKKYVSAHKLNQLGGGGSGKRNYFVTCFRAQMMMATCLAILAVDFTLFPRRFAKTETFGVSIMDIGVGAFVMSSGLTSKYARSNGTTGINATSGGVSSIVRPILPVLVLGIARLLTVKGVEYQEHVSEYGVHWNFYFTLASVHIGFVLIRKLAGAWCVSIPMAGALVVVYQLLLSKYGLEDYILHAPRTTFVSQNREGLCSWIGYLSIYILSSCLSRRWIFTRQNPKRSLIMLSLLQVGFWFATTYGSQHVTPPSRRMVNATYVSWVLAQGLLLLNLLQLVQLSSSFPITPRVFHGISKQQLVVFFIANLLTGAVNLSIYTLYATPPVAMCILLAYMLIVSVLGFVFGGRKSV